MAKNKQQKKKKERERKNKEQVLHRRQTLRSEQKAVNDKRKAQRNVKKLLKEKEKLEAMNEQIISRLPPEVRAKIEHNIKILKALEEEHAKEMKAKETLHSGLEAKGYLTLEQKLGALTEMQKLSVQDELEDVRQVGGAAECSMSINEESVEE